jgi:hypothetical protein
MSTFATANVYGEVREEVDLPYIKKTGDTASGKIIFDGGIECNIGTATFNGPIIATDQVTIQPSGSLFVDGPSEFAEDVTISGGTLEVNVPATFNETVIYNDVIDFNNAINLNSSVVVAPSSTVTVNGEIDFNGITDFNSTPTFNGGANFVGGGATTTVQSTGMVVSDPTINALSNFLTQSLNFQDTLVVDRFTQLDIDSMRISAAANTFVDIQAVVPAISMSINDGGGQQSQAAMTVQGFSCADTVISPQTNFIATKDGNIVATSRSVGAASAQLQLININTTGGAENGVNIQTYKQKTSGPGANGDEVFRLAMFGENANNAKEEYGRITCNVRDASAPSAGADGQILFSVPVGDVITTFIDINGNNGRVNLLREIDIRANHIVSTTDDIELNATASTGLGDVILFAKNTILFKTGAGSQPLSCTGNSVSIQGPTFINQQQYPPLSTNFYVLGYTAQYPPSPVPTNTFTTNAWKQIGTFNVLAPGMYNFTVTMSFSQTVVQNVIMQGFTIGTNAASPTSNYVIGCFYLLENANVTVTATGNQLNMSMSGIIALPNVNNQMYVWGRSQLSGGFFQTLTYVSTYTKIA